MFYVFTGDDRQKIGEEVKRLLGEDYEVYEGENLEIQDLANICRGRTLFSERRKILIRDLTPARKDEGEESAPGIDFYTELIKYVNTPHEVVIWETTTSKKKSFQEFKKAKGVKAQKFEVTRRNRAFEIADLAVVNGAKAVEEIEKAKDELDPYMFMGLLVRKLSERYEYRMGAKDKKALEELAELDMLTKTSTIEPWTLIEQFLIRFF